MAAFPAMKGEIFTARCSCACSVAVHRASQPCSPTVPVGPAYFPGGPASLVLLRLLVGGPFRMTQFRGLPRLFSILALPVSVPPTGVTTLMAPFLLLLKNRQLTAHLFVFTLSCRRAPAAAAR